MNKSIKKLFAFILSLTEKQFYGKIEIVFKGGKIIHVEKRENVKLN